MAYTCMKYKETVSEEKSFECVDERTPGVFISFNVTYKRACQLLPMYRPLYDKTSAYQIIKTPEMAKHILDIS